MSDHTEAGRFDERTAERLLAGTGTGGPAPLHALLSAAAAPGRPGELAGEDAAVAAFLAARARRSWPAHLRRFLSAKVIALVSGGAILLTGGVSYATGHFPGQNPAPAPSPTRHEHGGADGDSTPATQYSPSPLPTAPSSPPAPSPTSSAAGEQHGKSSAPGRQKNSPNPHSTSPPPRGPGNNNGTPPTANPGTGGSRGNSGSNNGSPPGENSGNGKQGKGQDKPE